MIVQKWRIFFKDVHRVSGCESNHSAVCAEKKLCKYLPKGNRPERTPLPAKPDYNFIRLDEGQNEEFHSKFSDILEDKKLTYINDKNKKTYIEDVLTSFEATAWKMATIDPLEGFKPNWYINNIKALNIAIKYQKKMPSSDIQIIQLTLRGQLYPKQEKLSKR